jgi:ABC-type dipeptide/oligopeptide/nickel transport system ATPase component
MTLLEVRDLELDVVVGDDRRQLLHGVSLSVNAGEALGLVGESGSGKSMTTRAIMRLLPTGATTRGEVVFDGRSVPAMDREQLRRFRSHDVAMIFQDPRAHINPMRSVGDFLVEALVTTRGVRRRDAARTMVDLLDSVGVADAARRMRQRPHELSGGTLQRVMIAAALAIEPRLILADEPTTALDVTTQEEVVAILDELRRDRGLAMLFVTHDLDLASAVCSRLAVMKGGAIVEELPTADIHDQASDPYTKKLLAAHVVFAPRSGQPHPDVESEATR